MSCGQSGLIWDAHRIFRDRNYQGVEGVSVKTRNGYLLEVRIPRKILGQFRAPQDEEFALDMDFSVIDAEPDFKDGGPVKSKLVWQGDDFNYEKIDNYGIMLLQPRGR